jgi:hypothetical protein
MPGTVIVLTRNLARHQVEGREFACRHSSESHKGLRQNRGLECALGIQSHVLPVASPALAGATEWARCLSTIRCRREDLNSICTEESSTLAPAGDAQSHGLPGECMPDERNAAIVKTCHTVATVSHWPHCDDGVHWVPVRLTHEVPRGPCAHEQSDRPWSSAAHRGVQLQVHCARYGLQRAPTTPAATAR